MHGAIVYWRPTPECATAIHQWCRRAGMDKPTKVHKLHCTIVYNEDWEGDLPVPIQLPYIKVPSKSIQLAKFGLKQNVLVATFVHQAPVVRNRSFALSGLRHSFPLYRPHITLTKHWGDHPLTGLPQWDVPLTFGTEIVDRPDPEH